MDNEEDEELERIKLKKLRELLKASEKRGQTKEQILNKPVKLTDNGFNEFIKSHSLVVVDCWAPWCGPCLYVAPVIEELARDYAGKISFGKLNVDENPKVAMQYGIMSIPTLLVFKNGKLVDRIIGAMPRQLLEPRITRHL
ncbi:MAG TPA: thioredoxin [Candidatus Bathyarchaeota archaeon]|nr:MAG: thioredoxin [Candidatus Bathyarchaeota archaeon]HDN05947.1 thioredoxin [Candidatus Bathyarchaeota archaeon]